MRELFGMKCGLVIWCFGFVCIGVIGAETIGRPEIYPEEDLQSHLVARELSPAEMRAGIEAALALPDWKPSDHSKVVNKWTRAGGAIASPLSAPGHDAVGRIRCAAWAWSNGLGEETLWVGSSSGGLYMLGRNPLVPSIRWWVPVSESLPGSPSVGAFLVKPGNSNVILVGTGDPGREWGSGLYRTTDGGATWTHITMSPEPSTFYKLLLDPADSADQTVFAATSLGIYVSFDFGEVWTRIGAFSGSRVTDFVRAAGDSDYLVGIANSGISRCSQLLFGSSCTAATGVGGTVGRVSIVAAPSNSAWVFALVSDDFAYNGVYRSSDGGSTFVNIDDHFSGGGDPLAWGQGWHTGAIAVDPANPDRLIVGMAAAQMTFNATAANPGDVCWRRNTGVTVGSSCDTFTLDAGHVDQTSMSFVPQTLEPGNTTVLITNDGGIFVYDWSADTIDDSYNEVGLNVSQVTLPRTFDRSRSNPNRLLAGLQDNGIMRVNLDGVPSAYEALLWNLDGGQVSIHPNNDGDFAFVKGMAYNRRLWTDLEPDRDINVNLTGNGPFEMSMVYNHNLITPVIFTHQGRYIYYRFIWDSDTTDWKYANPNHPLPLGVDVENIETSSDGTLTVYVTDRNSASNGTAALYILTGTLGDMSWVDGTPSGAFVPQSPAGGKVFADRSVAGGDHVYFVTGSHRPSRAFLSSNHGDGAWWDVTGDLETTLPGVDYWQLLSHPADHTILFLATEVGIFRSDGGGHWYRYMGGLPAVVKVRAMQIHSNGPDDTELVIGTWGNGLWKRSVEIDDHLFGDGFEGGSTTRWDQTVTGS